MTIRIKRAYDPAEPGDGRRFLVDRLWPRGRKKEQLALEQWFKEVAPSDELRKWVHADPARWEEFRERYRRELAERPDAWEPLLEAARAGDVTLVYSARDPERNNAAVLRDFLAERLEQP